MKLIPVSLALFYRKPSDGILEVWTQRREDDGIFHGLQEFPGGGIEENETPMIAAVREVEEEVGIKIKPEDGKFMGIYSRHLQDKTILLYVNLFPDQAALAGKGRWLQIEKNNLSAPYEGVIPEPNHKIIDDLYKALYE